MLTELKLLLGINDTSKDDLLTLILSQCTADFETFTHTIANTDLSHNRHTILQMAVYRFNTIGSEGLTGEEYSGVKYNYISNYPDYILADLRSQRKVRTIV